MKNGINQLIADAKSANLIVMEEAGRVIIRKGKSPRSVGIVIYTESGNAHRSDVDLELCNAIRSQKEMRKILGI